MATRENDPRDQYPLSVAQEFEDWTDTIDPPLVEEGDAPKGWDKIEASPRTYHGGRIAQHWTYPSGGWSYEVSLEGGLFGYTVSHHGKPILTLGGYVTAHRADVAANVYIDHRLRGVRRSNRLKGLRTAIVDMHITIETILAEHASITLSRYERIVDPLVEGITSHLLGLNWESDLCHDMGVCLATYIMGSDELRRTHHPIEGLRAKLFDLMRHMAEWPSTQTVS